MDDRTYTEARQHMAEIERIKRRWFDGEISMRQKQELIREANIFYRGDQPNSLTPARTLVTSPADDEPEREWYR